MNEDERLEYVLPITSAVTETEWLAFTSPLLMLQDVLKWRTSDRKLRLLGCACCRCVWERIDDERSRSAVEGAEAFADGLIGRAALGAMFADARSAIPTDDMFHPRHAAAYVATSDAWPAAYFALEKTAFVDEPLEAKWRRQMALTRDIFGNPFRPVTFDPAWRTTDVLLLANGIYAEKAFDRMPILADALQDAGCDSDALLTHLRDTNATHVRGCWALDLVLGKE